jgi:hypothetical protein
MKKLFILSFAIASSLLFVQCKKTETLNEEVITTVKSLSQNSLEGTWAVRSLTSVPRSIDLRWTKKFPKFTFSADQIELKMGLDLCDKQYTYDNDVLTVAPLSTCSITNNDHVNLNDLFVGDFTLTFSTDLPGMLSIKNNDGTEIVLTRINQLGSTTAEPTGIQVN